MVRVRTHSAHSVGPRLGAHHGSEATNDSRLVLDLDVNWVVGIGLPTIGHGSLRASSSLS